MNITLDTTTVVLAIFGALMAIITFFLQSVYSDFKQNKKELVLFKQKTLEDIGKLKGQVELAQQEQRMKHDQIEAQTQLKLQSLAENVNRLTNTVEKLITHSKTEN